ncbi:hypothetical protein E8E13_007757 [Curvularia kusanoi]|uniref:Uncharacterized protein n=1 Tax=Curvularia kusanoi TaxID=90978 RepID=A0A9P4TB70_CURKU|nr:hypothetical protein E8E13_007757 [Curvularia kusanoi]
MFSTTHLLAFTALITLAQARVFHPLPPIQVRDTAHNSTTPYPAGGNSTLSHTVPSYDHSTAWRVYIGFLVFGILTAILVPLVATSPDTMSWYRGMRGLKKAKKIGYDVEFASAVKMSQMKRPEGAHMRPE